MRFRLQTRQTRSFIVHTVPLTLLTIIGEGLLRERLITEIERAGAKGYTITECSGSGSRHRRVGELLGENMKLECVVSPEVADKLLGILSDEYFPHFAVIAYLSPVSVIRGDKYV
ncbi:transcriptional regulator [Planctopirus hydrillae]|uniref:Transcriptional regulator n=1 Tax=Planctopirus hydrillae TaxID=1841610 RepID=A0A1C3E6J8_9PLAN|nr:transcriptional regulator [Planctopirus hydrillae]